MIQPHMSPAETTLFEHCLAQATRYFEFGVGGSTVAAWRLAQQSGRPLEIHGIDSSIDWIRKVEQSVASSGQVHLRHVPIGAVGDWGKPVNPMPNPVFWPRYPEAIRACPQPQTLDLVLVDGRFRVACVIQTLLCCAPTTRILIHDYASRPEYHAVESWCERVDAVEDLALFAPRPQLPRGELEMKFQHFWKDSR